MVNVKKSLNNLEGQKKCSNFVGGVKYEYVMKIRRVKICNVKGIREHSIEALLHPNRPNILVAPNGFGKSSIATAFASIESSGINLSEDNAYNNNKSNLGKLDLLLL